MKKYILSVIITFIALIVNGQNNLAKTDDLGRISLMAVIPQQVEGLPEAAHNQLYNKLNQIAVKNGLGGGYNDRFVITANVVVLEKNITSSAPPMHVYTLELTLYIADYVDKTIFSSVTKEVKGVGKSETKAYLQALKNINPSDPVIRRAVETGKEKIIELYNSQCDIILSQAEALASQKKYEESIYRLMSIPEVCKECYSKALDKVDPVYKQYADFNCEQMLLQAKAAWGGAQNYNGAVKAGTYLAQIDPDAACVGDAEALITEIKSKIKLEEDRVWDFELNKWDDVVSVEEQRIETQKEIGINYANDWATQYGYYHNDYINWIFNH